MPDMEKVIRGLECHRIDSNHRINCTDCPYYADDDNHIRCVNDLHDDTLSLLEDYRQHLQRDLETLKERKKELEFEHNLVGLINERHKQNDKT